MKALNEKEFLRINEPKVLQEFEKKIDEVGYHLDFQVSDFKNGVQNFKVFDKKIIIKVLEFMKFFKVDTQSLFYDKGTNLAYLSAIIDYPSDFRNHKSFDDYCIDICQNWYSENGLPFSVDDADILVSYPHTIEPQKQS